MVNVDRFHRSCNTLDDPSGKTSVANEIEDTNLNLLNLVTRINES